MHTRQHCTRNAYTWIKGRLSYSIKYTVGTKWKDSNVKFKKFIEDA